MWLIPCIPKERARSLGEPLLLLGAQLLETGARSRPQNDFTIGVEPPSPNKSKHRLLKSVTGWCNDSTANAERACSISS